MRNELSTINNDNINDYIMIDTNNFIKKTPFYIAIDSLEIIIIRIALRFPTQSKNQEE